MISGDGSGNNWVKIVNGAVSIGAGGQEKLLVSPYDTVIKGDVQLSGGMPHDCQFVRLNVLANTTPLMTSSIVAFSGTAALNTTEFRFTRIPLPKAGSVQSITLLTQGATVKTGELSGTVLVNGTPTAATIGMHTGTIQTRLFDKDAVTFDANSYLELQLTASTAYTTDVQVTSGSWLGLVVVEY